MRRTAGKGVLVRAAGEGGSELARKRRVNRLLLVFEQDVCERAALGRGLYISGGGSSRDTTICVGLAGSRRSRGRGGNIGGLSILLV